MRTIGMSNQHLGPDVLGGAVILLNLRFLFAKSLGISPHTQSHTSVQVQSHCQETRGYSLLEFKFRTICPCSALNSVVSSRKQTHFVLFQEKPRVRSKFLPFYLEQTHSEHWDWIEFWIQHFRDEDTLLSLHQSFLEGRGKLHVDSWPHSVYSSYYLRVIIVSVLIFGFIQIGWGKRKPQWL